MKIVMKLYLYNKIILLMLCSCFIHSFANANSLSHKDINTRVDVPDSDMYIIKGRVIDILGNSLSGANISVKGTLVYTTSNGKGVFSIKKDKSTSDILVVSYIGMETQNILCKKGEFLTIKLNKKIESIKEVIVTGIYSRKKSSFTGAATTYTQSELMMMSDKNIIASLKSLEPALFVVEDNNMGSDPNILPNIEIRGKTSVIGLREEYAINPNQPLFILDGFESDIQSITDISISRIRSVSVLKDAASTAIYGSKAANGVIVVETIRPKEGRLSVSYSGNYSFQIPDFSDYNLMNSKEKLEFEKLSGRFDAYNIDLKLEKEKYYNQRLSDIYRGVDTYWLNEAVRNSFSYRHNIHINGGSKKIRYSIGLNHGNTEGVMKGSDRTISGANVNLSYRTKKLKFILRSALNHSKANRESVSFSDFSRANPYFSKFNESGKDQMILGNYLSKPIINPMYTQNLPYLDLLTSMNIRNNISLEWNVLSNLKFRTRLGMSMNNSGKEKYTSFRHPRFINTKILQRGEYYNKNSEKFQYNGDVTLSYAKTIAENHTVNIIGGWSFSENNSEYNAYSAVGFVSDRYMKPSFASAYKTGSKPVYNNFISKSTSFYTNFNYSYKEKYLLDLNLRADGSSVFGVNKRFNNTWSCGLAWNLHKEALISNISFLNLFKIRASVGNPGNQNFSPYQSIKTYTYNSWMQNVFGASAIIDNFGNKNLKWQRTLDKNIGVNMVLLGNKLKLSFDIYRKDTDPLLISTQVPSSLGFATMYTNLGSQINKGYYGRISYSPIYKPAERINWSLNLSVAHNKSEYLNIGNSLDIINNNNRKSSKLTRYYDGASADDIWAVPSLGIDPSTGKEIFVKKDGSYTFKFDQADEIVVGNSRPKVSGIIGTTLFYKGFSASVNMRYQYGGQAFAYALYNKVENISKLQLNYNQDKRALSDRWVSVGDNTRFKGVSLSEHTPISSRFVLNENVISLESVSLAYQSSSPILHKVGLQSLSLRVYMNDIYRLSSIKVERGIDYPFARTVSFSVNARF